MHILKSLWNYRYFIVASIRGDLKRRFARSHLGGLWFILHPLAQAAILALVLSEVLAAKLPGMASKAGYAVWLLAGMAAWSLFAEIVTRCTTIFIEYSGALKKLSFPRLCLPVIVGGTALLNHLLLLAAITIVLPLLGHPIGIAWIALPVGIALIAAFGFGLGVLLGTFNVFARDVAQVAGIVMQLWFWLTPVVYTPQTLPAELRWLVNANPMAAVVRIYQDVILYDRWPQWQALYFPAGLALALFALSFLMFRRASAELVDAL